MSNDIGTLVSRVALGTSIAAHGAQKAWGWFGGPGPQGAAQFLESLRFVPGERFATAASTSEIVSGALIALGLGGPIGPAAVISTMIVAQTTVHAKNGFFSQNGGIELGTIYSAGALALAAGGYGRLSLDGLFGWTKLRESWVTALALAGGTAAAFVVLGQRTQAGSPPPVDVAPGRVDITAQPDPIATVQSHIAAAADDRPLPADLLVANDENAAPQL